MISLRGQIRRSKIEPSSSSLPNDNDTFDTATLSNDSPKTPLHCAKGEWVWTGHWAFGTLPEVIIDGRQSSGHKRRRVAGVRAFSYKFDELVDPKDVKVPSAETFSNGNGVNDEEEKVSSDRIVSEENQSMQSSTTVHSGEVDKKSMNVNHTDGSARNGSQENDVGGCQSQTNVGTFAIDETDVVQNSPQIRQEDSDAKSQVTSNEPHDISILNGTDHISESPVDGEQKQSSLKNTHDSDQSRKDQQLDNTHSSKARSHQINGNGSAADSPIKHDRGNPISPVHGQENNPTMDKDKTQSTKLKDTNLPSKAINDDSTRRNSNPSYNQKDHAQNPPNLSEEKIDGKAYNSSNTKEKLNNVTFATTTSDNGKFTDAGITTQVGTCPLGGSWKGYFENISKRKDRSSSRITEKFYLFFNSTPSHNARITFEDPDHDINKDVNGETEDQHKHEEAIETMDEETRIKTGYLPKGHIHVRGMGTNQFGVFEIVGGYDLKTGILNCKRMYITSMEVSEEKGSNINTVHSGNNSTSETISIKSQEKRSRRASWDNSSLTTFNTGSITPARSHSTRKRRMSWKKAFDSDVSDHNVNGHSVRRRSVSTSSVPSMAMTGKALNSLHDNKGNSMSSLDIENTSNMSAQVYYRNASDSSLLRNMDTAKILPKSKQITSKGTPSSCKGQKSKSRQKSSPDESSLNIPLMGHPKDAQWRAAHYLYYQKEIPENTDATSDSSPSLQSQKLNGTNNKTSNSPSSSNTTVQHKFVVYEGEMNYGGNLRDGQGICLYNNGTIYEGSWKKNKEHGHGVLVTGDRKRIIYEGTWERGKMHGKGTYYYHLYDGIQNDNYVGSDIYEKVHSLGIYCGDFKENSRHGYGKYTLPDGSEYDGEWRDNIPSGRGTFRWVDGSTYVGQWKEGKRSGPGRLNASDGFSYDGFWVNNGMEGRGIATYPNGQIYEGMFAAGMREGRGTVKFTNGSVYEGRFRNDCMEGQGTLKMSKNAVVTTIDNDVNEESQDENKNLDGGDLKDDFMIPIEFQSDIGHIHQKAGFTSGGS